MRAAGATVGRLLERGWYGGAEVQSRYCNYVLPFLGEVAAANICNLHALLVMQQHFAHNHNRNHMPRHWCCRKPAVLHTCNHHVEPFRPVEQSGPCCRGSVVNVGSNPGSSSRCRFRGRSRYGSPERQQ